MIAPPKPNSPLSPLEIAVIAGVVVIWGVNNAAAKVMTGVAPPLMVAAARFVLALVCLIPFIRRPFPNWKSLLIIAGVGGPLHYGLIYLAFALAEDVSTVSVAAQLWIPFTTLFAFLLLGERVRWPAIAGMAVAFAGVVWMTLDPHVLADWLAIGVGVLASACWAITTVVARRTTSIPPLKMQGLLAAFSLPTLAAASAVFETGQGEVLSRMTPLLWACLVWAGIVSSVVATTLVFWLVQRREAGRVTPYLLATPVVSIALGAVMGDTLTVQILTGAALTIVGVALVSLAERGLRAGAQGQT